jgi:hypothetical protein
MSLRLALTCLAMMISMAWAADAPKFSDFPATVYTGKVHKPILDSPDKREFRTRINEAAKGKPNFAGNYILATWGCGAGCLAGAMIDAKTGVVTFLPWSVCCTSNYEVEPIQYRPDSRLLLVVGLLNEEGTDSQHYFQMTNGALTPVATIPN